METRFLHDIEVSAVGMGCMAFSHGYGKIPPESYSIEAIRGAYEHGCTLFDTAEVYGPDLSPLHLGHNERIVGKALAGVRGEMAIATKMMPGGGLGRDAYRTLRKHLEGSLSRLRTDYVDLYYIHRSGGSTSRRRPALWAGSSARGSSADGASRRSTSTWSIELSG